MFTSHTHPGADGLSAEQASAERHRGQAQRHNEARNFDTGTSRHVHGHGHDGRAASWFFFILISFK